MPRRERSAIALGVLLLVALPTAQHGWPTTPSGSLFTVLILAGGLALVWWRSHPRVASVVALGLFLAAVTLPGSFPDTGVALYSVSFAVLALGWSGRAAWVVALCAAAYLAVFSSLAQMDSWVAALMFTVPPYAAGTALRLRRETADLLAARAQELEDERELFAEIALRHERARIASELHDIVGHAISVMVIQAAAG
ncbi:MAG: histidine kinase, partial [Nocardioidaceae bacterium]